MAEPKDQRVQIVAERSWLAKVDAWRKTQQGPPNRSQAIRQLVVHGLAYWKLLESGNKK